MHTLKDRQRVKDNLIFRYTQKASSTSIKILHRKQNTLIFLPQRLEGERDRQGDREMESEGESLRTETDRDTDITECDLFPGPTKSHFCPSVGSLRPTTSTHNNSHTPPPPVP